MSKKIKVILACSSANIGGAEKNIFLINKIFNKKKNFVTEIIYLRKTKNNKILFFLTLVNLYYL